jgi:nicotinate dehydrogenase subunit B
VPDPAVSGMGPMPAFGPVLSDSQVADLVGFLRRRYAPGRPGWTGLDQAVARLRAPPGP